MASSQKISELTTAGPLTGAELVPIVQNGGTLQTTVSAVAAFVVVSLTPVVSALATQIEQVSAAVSVLGAQTSAALVSVNNTVSALQVQVNAVSVSVSQRVLRAGDTMTGPLIVDVNSASDALRITQTGAGNALVVEDSANPDSTPFVVDASGEVILGTTLARSSYSALLPKLQIHGIGNNNVAASITDWQTNGFGGPFLNLDKSKGGSVGTRGIVADNDRLGWFTYSGDDGINFIPAARIEAFVDGTPGTNDMPGRLVFSTTADGASSPTERMRIDNTGQVGVGGAPAAGRNFVVSKNITGSTTSRGVTSIGQIQSDATGVASYFATSANTVNSTFTLSRLEHYIAIQGAFGASSTVTNQMGFYADPTLTGATNNFGFYSDIASGTGRWNFYANGTAPNYFAGQVQLGAGSAGTPALGAFGDTNTGMFFPAADTIAFAEGGVETMRLDSSGRVGIGTSSPGVNLDVVGAGTQSIRARSSDTTGSNLGRVMAEFAGGSSALEMRAGLGYTILLSANATDPLIFGAGGGTERMRITAAGNVGIGTSAPLNRLDVSGSFGRGAPVTKTGNFTLAATENWIICNGAGTITVTFPAASLWTGREVMIKTIAAQTVVSASSNVVPLAGGAAGTAILAATAGARATLVSDGTNWIIMQA
jgi:hypothetical protein